MLPLATRGVAESPPMLPDRASFAAIPGTYLDSGTMQATRWSLPASGC